MLPPWICLLLLALCCLLAILLPVQRAYDWAIALYRGWGWNALAARWEKRRLSWLRTATALVGVLGVICLAVVIAWFCQNHIWYVISGEAFRAKFSLSSPWSSVPAIRGGFFGFTVFATVALPYAAIVGWKIDRTTAVGYWSFLISAIALCFGLLGLLTCTMAKMIIYIRDMGFTDNRVKGLLYGLGGYLVIAAFLYWAARSPRKSKDPGTVECPCGYDLTANETGICPECGERIPMKIQRNIEALGVPSARRVAERYDVTSNEDASE